MFTATAIEGIGVAETFLGLASLSWERLEAKFNFADRFGVTHDDFMGRVDELFRGGLR